MSRCGTGHSIIALTRAHTAPTTLATKTWLEVVESFAGTGTGGYERFWLDHGRHIITVDGQKRSSIVSDPPDG